MENLLEIKQISKKYPKFELKDVSFNVKKGQIVGFIGRNGAGKTTTLKGIMGLIHLDGGEINAFETSMIDNALENKQRIGFALSELSYYPNVTIRKITNVTKRFYKNFSDEKFDKYCKLFNLDPNKKLEELSSGMKVKYSVAIALSHDAELLILDEPTSGLDPISRDEVLDIFRSLVKSKERGLLFSTHITSDLDKCATDIVFIHEGKIIYQGSKKDFINAYKFVSGKMSELNENYQQILVNYKEIDGNFEGLVSTENIPNLKAKSFVFREPTLEEIMVFVERSYSCEEFDL